MSHVVEVKQERSEALTGSVLMHAVYLHWPRSHSSDSNKKAEGREGEKERKKIACKGMRCGFGVYTYRF
jgi:hypothetical protein